MRYSAGKGSRFSSEDGTKSHNSIERVGHHYRNEVTPLLCFKRFCDRRRTFHSPYPDVNFHPSVADTPLFPGMYRWSLCHTLTNFSGNLEFWRVTIWWRAGSLLGSIVRRTTISAAPWIRVEGFFHPEKFSAESTWQWCPWTKFEPMISDFLHW